MKWKIEKKYLNIAVITFTVIILAILFQYTLEHEKKMTQFYMLVQGTLAPIVFGFLLAYLLNPILGFFERCFFTPLANIIWKKEEKAKTRHKFSRGLGIVFTIMLFLFLIIGALYMVIPQVYQSLEKIVTDAPTYYNSAVKWLNSLDSDKADIQKYFLLGLDRAYSQAFTYLNDNIIPNMDKIVAGITSGIVGGLKILLNMILALIISVYVMAEKEIIIGVCKKLNYSLFSEKNANAVLRGIRYADNVFGGFINGKIIDSFIIGVLCYVVMQFLELEYSVLISIIIGVTNVIPYFGPIIGAVPSVLILLMVDVKQGLIFLIFVIILQQIDGNILGPLILGDRLNLSSMWILFAILVGGGFFGVPGMILGAPCFACIYALVGTLCRSKLKRKDLPTEAEEYYAVVEIHGKNIIKKEFDKPEEYETNKMKMVRRKAEDKKTKGDEQDDMEEE